jgi:frataxin-like iron-binding protein CyaY
MNDVVESKTEPTELESFEHWLQTAKGGSVYNYADGTWLDQRKRHSMAEYVHSEDTRATAKAAWKAYEDGLVELV